METVTLEKLRFPIGRFAPPEAYNAEQIKLFINEIEKLPVALRQETNGLSDDQLDQLYRPEGWTIRQVVHHLADSHLNSYTRFKLALTEDHPSIRPYQEGLWAELPDGKHAPIDLSLDILDSLHRRWVLVLQQMTPEQWTRTFFHPEYKTTWSIQQAMAIYAWHGKHHLAHITELKNRMGW